MRELLKKLVGIEPMTEDEKESVLLCIPVSLLGIALFYLAAVLG